MAGASWDERGQTDISKLEVKNAIESLKKVYLQMNDDKTKEWLSKTIETLTKLT